MSEERTQYTSHQAHVEVRVAEPQPGVITLNVGGTYVSLSRNEADRLGRDLVQRANRPTQPTVRELYAEYVAAGILGGPSARDLMSDVV